MKKINFLKDLKENSEFLEKYSINLVDPVDFQLNKFFYKHRFFKWKINGEIDWVDGTSFWTKNPQFTVVMGIQLPIGLKSFVFEFFEKSYPEKNFQFFH